MLITILAKLDTQGDGILYASMSRSRLLHEYCAIAPTYFTCNWEPNPDVTLENLTSRGLLPPGTVIWNQFSSLLDLFNDGKIEVIGIDRQLIRRTSSSVPLYRQYSDYRGLIRRDVYLSPRRPQVEEYLSPDGDVLCRMYRVSNHAKAQIGEIELNVGGQLLRLKGESELRCVLLSLLIPNGAMATLLCDHYQLVHSVGVSPWLNDHKLKTYAIIHNAHRLATSDWPNKAYQQLLANPRGVDGIICLTQHQAEDVAADGCPRDKLITIPHAMDPDTYCQQWQGRRVNQLIYLARYSEVKRHVLLFNVINKVRLSVPDVTLHCYGAGPMRRALNTKIKDMELDSAIFLHGHVDDTSQVYRQASLAVLPSKQEGSSLFCLESLAYGVPVVAFDIRYGPREVLDEGRGGVLVEDGDADAMAAAIVQLLTNPKALEGLRRQIPSVLSRFSRAAVAKRWDALLSR